MYSKNSLLDEIIFLESSTSKISKVPHLASDYGMRTIPTINSPFLRDEEKKEGLEKGFLPPHSYVYQGSYVLGNTSHKGSDDIMDIHHWLDAGPRRHIFFEPKNVKAAIVTCGGLCPGLNVVIREIYLCLKFLYGVEEVWGIQFGYEGFYKYDWVRLNNQDVKSIHFEGGNPHWQLSRRI